MKLWELLIFTVFFHLTNVSLLVFLLADHQQQPLDAAVLHFFPAYRQLLCAQHVRWCGGGELPQVPSAPGGGGGKEEGREATPPHGEEETE